MKDSIETVYQENPKNLRSVLQETPFYPLTGIEEVISKGKIIELPEGAIVTQQFEVSEGFHMLLDGSMRFYISVEDSSTSQELTVGNSHERFTPAGWSGFRSPYRYATTVSCESKCEFIYWKHKDLKVIFEQYPGLGRQFLYFVLEKSVGLLDQVRASIAEETIYTSDRDYEIQIEDQEEKVNPEPDMFALLRRSPFFEIFSEDDLRELSELGKIRHYLRGEQLFSQYEEPEGLQLLAYGSVTFMYEFPNPTDASRKFEPAPIRMINTPGYILGWSGATPHMVNEISAVCSKDTYVYYIEKDKLLSYLDENPSFGLMFTYRLLWLIGNQLRADRANYISQGYEHEIIAVKNLIDQNCTQLSVHSPLHKLPHLLSNTYTLSDAFNFLQNVKEGGSTVERSVANTSLSILKNVKKEQTFYERLGDVYQSVVDAPELLKDTELRKLSAEKFVHAFEDIPHVIEGWDNLPETPNHVFIYNHLKNHPFNTLPNNFQLTLDSHFISSMILFQKYGDPGVRVVRISRGVEFGHQNYYNRLGHIEVVTNESGKIAETKALREQKRKAFYEEAGRHLKEGRGVIISPEGTSYETHESPGKFKAGAFRIPYHVSPEPLIVPIAVANFDKRINKNRFAVKIGAPFYVSDLISDPSDKETMLGFLKNYRETFSRLVKEAIRMGTSRY